MYITTHTYQAKHPFMLCAIITRRLLEKCLFPLNVLVVLKYTIILHVFVLLGLSCGWTVNDNSHAVHLMFQYFELNFVLFYICWM